MKTEKQRVGNIGEDIACRFLEKGRHKVLERNYWKPYGEVDIITEKDNVLYFVEVKTVSYETPKSVSHETNSFRPEENLHPRKLQRLARTIQTYLAEKNVAEDIEWRCDAVIVFLDHQAKTAKVRLIEQIM